MKGYKAIDSLYDFYNNKAHVYYSSSALNQRWEHIKYCEETKITPLLMSGLTFYYF